MRRRWRTLTRVRSAASLTVSKCSPEAPSIFCGPSPFATARAARCRVLRGRRSGLTVTVLPRLARQQIAGGVACKQSRQFDEGIATAPCRDPVEASGISIECGVRHRLQLCKIMFYLQFPRFHDRLPRLISGAFSARRTTSSAICEIGRGGRG